MKGKMVQWQNATLTFCKSLVPSEESSMRCNSCKVVNHDYNSLHCCSGIASALCRAILKG